MKTTPLKPKKKMVSRKIKWHVRIHSIVALLPIEEAHGTPVLAKVPAETPPKPVGMALERTHLGLANWQQGGKYFLEASTEPSFYFAFHIRDDSSH